MKRISIVIGLAFLIALVPLLVLTCDNDDGNGNGNGNETKSLVADFTASLISGSVPLEVQFTDQSTGNITEWEWNFGDNNVSSEQNPTHTYTTADVFNVILIVTDADGETDSVTATITATEAGITTYTLNTSISPSEAGTVSPASGDYEEGSEVTLTATPAEGYVFDSWSGDASGSSATVTVTMNSDMSLVANFEQVEPDPESDITVEEQVVFDQYGITIRVESLDLESNILGPELKLLIENQSDQDITVEVRHMAINDVMIASTFSSSVPRGESVYDGIIFDAFSLATAGIETIKDIEFEFHIFDTDTEETIVDSDTIEIRTSVDDSFVQEYDDSGEIVLDENDIKVVVKGLDTTDCSWGAEVLVYIENNTDKDFRISAVDVLVNGSEISPVFFSDVLAGKKAFDSIKFLESDLADNDIDAISTIVLSFHVVGLDPESLILDSDPITISFE